MCQDEDGCEVRLGVANWDGNDRLSVYYHGIFSISLTNNTWFMADPNSTSSGTDNNNSVEHVGAYGCCYFTDGAYSWNGSSWSATDNAIGFGLLKYTNCGNSGWNQGLSRCVLTVKDQPEGTKAFDRGNLVNSFHNASDCSGSGKQLVKLDGTNTDQSWCESNPGQCFCKITGDSCPPGWSQYLNWSSTQPRYGATNDYSKYGYEEFTCGYSSGTRNCITWEQDRGITPGEGGCVHWTTDGCHGVCTQWHNWANKNPEGECKGVAGAKKHSCSLPCGDTLDCTIPSPDCYYSCKYWGTGPVCPDITEVGCY
jgi:hypothetical protein